jgi:hypothetical protein
MKKCRKFIEKLFFVVLTNGFDTVSYAKSVGKNDSGTKNLTEYVEHRTLILYSEISESEFVFEDMEDFLYAFENKDSNYYSDRQHDVLQEIDYIVAYVCPDN